MRPPVKQQAPHHFLRRWPRARRQDRAYNKMPLVVEKQVSVIKHVWATPGVLMDKLAGKIRDECPAGYYYNLENIEVYDAVRGCEFYLSAAVIYHKKEKP